MLVSKTTHSKFYHLPNYTHQIYNKLYTTQNTDVVSIIDIFYLIFKYLCILYIILQSFCYYLVNFLLIKVNIEVLN